MRAVSNVLLGACALGLIVYWLGTTAPAIASPSSVPPEVSRAGVGSPHFDVNGRVRADLGCADDVSPTALHEFFAERRGPLLGWDNPHVIELETNRWLWLVHDTYLDYSGDATDLDSMGGQIQNAAFIQDESCFSVVHGGTPWQRANFEIGDERLPFGHFLWPLGMEVDDDRLWVFWGETVTADPPPPRGHGIIRHPVGTWLASYDVDSLERLSFDPAPNSGVDPVYGFAVASDDEHSFLFGNTNQLNLWRNGGYENGPHSTTKMYLARVPLGQLDADPSYWDGASWSEDASDAVPITDRFWAENTMQPRYIDGQWISVVQRDGFFGVDVWLEVAPNPWGPWIAAETLPYEPRPAKVEKNSYQPIILPWSSADQGISIAISENAVLWRRAIADPSLYRPGVFSLDWPDDAEARMVGALEMLANSE